VTTKVPFGDGTISAYFDTSSGALDMELGSLESADLTITTEYEISRSVFVDQERTASLKAFISVLIIFLRVIIRLKAMNTALPQTDEAIQVAAEIKAITA